MSFLKRVTKAEKEVIDRKGDELLKLFAANLTAGIYPEDAANKDLVQQHFDWFKTFMNKSKLVYMGMVKRYTTDTKTIIALNTYAERLGAYVRDAALAHLKELD